MKGSFQEKLLLYRIRSKKDAEAFAELYDQYVEPIYRYIYFKISSRTDAEDITSTVFLRAWEYLMTGEEEVLNFRRFIYTIARHNIIDVYRQRARRLECSLDEASEVAVSASQYEAISNQHDAEKLVQQMKNLKQEYQDALALRYIEGLPIKDIALILGKGQGSIRVTLHRALKKLKEMTDTPRPNV